MTSMAPKREIAPTSRSVRDLMGAWEKRSSLASNTGNSNVGPKAIKSTKKQLEDLAVFASPRVIKKKFTSPHNTKDAPHVPPSSPPTPTPPQPTTPKAATMTTTQTAAVVPSPLDDPPLTPKPDEPHHHTGNTAAPPVSSIREKMKAFERHQTDHSSPAPWMTQLQRGKRGSVLDSFTPNQTSKPSLKNKTADSDTPMAALPSLEPPEEEEEDQEKEKEPIEEASASPDSTPKEEAEEEAETQSAPAQSGKIDRDTLVLTEIQKMILDVEEQEIEDEMEEEVKSCLVKAALQSEAYKRRWYDVMGDSWIHCPSLATLIMDFTVIELAEEIYEEELPMLYSVSLRAVAAEILKDEVELPEYVYRLAAEDVTEE